MKVIADTSVWSLFLRRSSKQTHAALDRFRELLREDRLVILGIIRQELLSGIKHATQFKKISSILEGFEEILATSKDHELAAKYFNTCRAKGVQGSPVDFLICALCIRRKIPILTTDRDFFHYAKHLPIKLDGFSQ